MIDLDKYIGQVDNDGRILRDRILKYENENNNLDEEIAQLNDTLIEFDRKIIGEQKELKALQNDLASLQSINDKFKSELGHFHKSTHS
jgi:chromosome segregation ATPase